MQPWNHNKKREVNRTDPDRLELAIGTTIIGRCYSQFWLPLIATVLLSFASESSRAQDQKTRQPQQSDYPAYTIKTADSWTRLFKRHTGWTGGDGIYSIKLPSDHGKKGSNRKEQVVFLFSDSVIDTLVNGKSTKNNFTMIHNATAVLQGIEPHTNDLHFHWQTNEKGDPASLFMPHTKESSKPTDDSIYYWLGDGIGLPAFSGSSATKAQPALAIFAYQMISYDSSPFGFRDIGNDLLFVDKNFQVLSTVSVPALKNGNFGAGIYRDPSIKSNNGQAENAPYIYIYGVRNMDKAMVVARTTDKGLATPADWQYFNGEGWTSDIGQCSEVALHVSNELSVSRTPDGQYVLIFQLDGIQPFIGMRLAPTPYGPFGPMDTIWHCQESAPDSNILVYNAKAHPVISPKNGLLISYNVNSLTFAKTLKTTPDFYRPRFLLLEWNKDGGKPKVSDR